MKNVKLLLALFGMVAAPLFAQEPVYYQVTNSIKVVPGKGSEYTKFMADTSAKIARTRIDAGEIVSWMLMRTVIPAGAEARADYMISTMYLGVPPAPRSREDTEKSLKLAGVPMTAAEFYAKRDSISSLVATEMWRPQLRVGGAQKGHYIYLNLMKVKDPAAFQKFEIDIQGPMFTERVKRGEMSGWSYGTRLLPAGTDSPYSAYTADIFPTWEAAFKQLSPGREVFAKVHPGKNADEVMGKLNSLRDHARRDLWVVVERIDSPKLTARPAAQ